MKFSQLKVGDQFILDGESYIKSTPLIAHHVNDGKQKMVPRYMNVELISDEASEPGKTKLTSTTEVLEHYQATLKSFINSSTLSDAAKELVNTEIDKAYTEIANKI